MNGILRSGEGAAAGFVRAVEDLLTDSLGFRPFPGTLNLAVDDRAAVDSLPRQFLPEVGNEHCDGVYVRPCTVAGVRAAVLRPLVPNYPEGKVELVAPVRLRSLFGLTDGAPMPVGPPEDLWAPDGPAVDPTALGEFDAVVFDLDGTLVDLDVDWSHVHDRVESLLTAELGGSIDEYTRPEVMALARETGKYDELAALLEEHERDGAETATRLALLDTVAHLECPVGVCTANADSAARGALTRFDAGDAVDCVVARGTVPEEKPDPHPLEHCLGELGVAPGNAVFVGDERSDAETALAAGTSFLHPKQLRHDD